MSQFTFNAVPKIKRPRSRFPMKHTYKTAFNMADLIPHYVQEVYPGDTFKLKDTFVLRTSVPFVRPIMDNVFLDTYYFFVPNRLVFDNWEELMGDNKLKAWKQTEIITAPEATGNIGVGTIADYMGIPPFNYETNSDYFNELPLRAYALIYDQWFRNENWQDPILINTEAGLNKNGKFNSNAFAPDNIMGKPAKINKLKDYFTSGLPAPQKHDAIGISFDNDLPVMTMNKTADSREDSANDPKLGLKWSNIDGSLHTFAEGMTQVFGFDQDTSFTSLLDDGGAAFSVMSDGDAVRPRNLFAATAGLQITNVNDLRYAFALQRLYEKDAIYGTRYTEMIEGHFGCTNPDARLQRAEYLGGKRIPIQLSQVANTNGASGSQLGNVGAFSLTNGTAGFSKAFTEHGFIIGVCAVRQLHTYQQGVEHFWFRQYRSDYYDPTFAFIGYQPIYKKELYSLEALSGSVWNYNQAWNDLRFRTNKITGMLRTDSASGLDIWHLGDNYGDTPTMGSEFCKETKAFLDRTLSAGGDTIPNFIMDVFHDSVAVRRLPVYSLPGLIDHF